MRYGSVCSGIEAATVAWHPLGWRPSFFSEIEAFPRAVLAHHYPDVPLHGDFTTIEAGQYEPIDALVGGTPCQSFSVAGLRGGLADDRGNLALEFLRLAQRLHPRWLVWENVPGVLSSNGGRDFGAILGGLVELGYGFAYRVLDAQHFGVPQRRRRVFVVGYLGDWRRAAAVLFERHSLSGNPPPRREAGKDVAGTIGASLGGCDENDAKDGRLIAPPLTHNPYGDHESREGLLVTHSLRADGFDASEDGMGRGTPLVACAYRTSPNNGAWETGERIDALTTGTDQTSHVVAFSSKDHGADAGDIAPTLRAMGHAGSHANAGGQVAVAFALGSHAGAADGDQTNRSHASGGPVGSGISEEVAYSLRSGRTQSIAASAVRRLTPRECERLQGFPDDYTLIPLSRGQKKAVTAEMAAYYRRTNQDFTDAELARLSADGPRYKSLGNSMAVPVMRWIGQRIAMVTVLP